MSDKIPLVSKCYDGRTITTPWPSGIRMSLAAQMHQANAHRETVRDHLYVQGLNKLSADSWWLA